MLEEKEANALRDGLRRFAARAVKAAQFAFTGAERTALTEEAGGKAHPYGRKGKKENVFVEVSD